MVECFECFECIGGILICLWEVVSSTIKHLFAPSALWKMLSIN